ncbi:LysR family transcriptional regulator [Alicyclobacillaceae bacterium I2511]|nr:LysR family transcriptional regulator [Alicyclobacillaceae bacterium I2511]
MELLQLKYFQTVAKYEHITQAAKDLNISQPSLSITISRLEEELGVPLFLRKGRNIKLNEFGKSFLRRVNSVFNELEASKQEIQHLKGIENSRVSLATTSTRFLSGLFKEFFADCPTATIHQYVDSAQKIETALRAGEIDYCITSPLITGKEIECVTLLEDEILLVVPPNHRHANQGSIRLAEVADDPFIDLVENYSFRKLTDSLCKQAGFKPNILFEGDPQFMFELLQSGMGVVLIPESICKRYQDIPVSLLKISEPIAKIEFGISWMKNRYFPESASRFRQFVIDYYGVGVRSE